MKKISVLLLSILSVMGFAQKTTYKVTSPVELNVMTFNIRLDSEKDGLNNWKNRKDIVANTIRYYEADIIGTQEVLHNQLLDMEALLPGYSSIGVARLS